MQGGTGGLAASIVARLEQIAGSAWFAYSSIALLQSKVLWGIWNHRDLSPGDTGSYFVMASRWAHQFLVDPAFYPLYHVLWGSLMWVVPNPYSVTILHRILIVLGTTLLLLAVLRRLLTPGIAWFLAVWWATLPIAYDVLYEIHLFGALACLAIVLVALRWSGLAGRATVFGLLLASALLVRNENVVAAGAFGLVWLGYELWRVRRGTAPPTRRLAAAAVMPLLGVALLVSLVTWRSVSDQSVLSQLRHKHEVNICQVYAQSLWQAGDVRAQNPHAQCFIYTRRDFGQRFPSLIEAVRENPGAMARHFARNAKLIPAGLEIDFFNEKYGSDSEASNPDYIPVKNGSWPILAGSLLIVGVLIVGAALLWRNRRRWWSDWIRERVWAWITLGALGTSALYAALMTRPRPSYMFPLSILIFASIGMSLVVIVNRLGIPQRGRAMLSVLALVAFILVPPHYRAGYSNPQIGPGQRLQRAVSRLIPFRDEIAGRSHGLLAEYPTTTACEYVGGTSPCEPISWNNPVAKTLEPELAGRKQDSFSPHSVDLIYADEIVLMENPTIRSRLDRLQDDGWRRLAPSNPEADWVLLARDPPPTSR